MILYIFMYCNHTDTYTFDKWIMSQQQQQQRRLDTAVSLYEICLLYRNWTARELVLCLHGHTYSKCVHVYVHVVVVVNASLPHFILHTFSDMLLIRSESNAYIYHLWTYIDVLWTCVSVDVCFAVGTVVSYIDKQNEWMWWTEINNNNNHVCVRAQLHQQLYDDAYV